MRFHRIPTGRLGYLLDAIQTLSKGESIAWLQLAVNLRTPTRNVIFNPLSEKFCGHIGSIYVLEKGQYASCTTGTNGFHNGLGDILMKHLGPNHSDLHGFRSALATFIDQNVWKGSLLRT